MQVSRTANGINLIYLWVINVFEMVIKNTTVSDKNFMTAP